MNEITVTSQQQLDNLPHDYHGRIYIKFGTPYDKAIVRRKYDFASVEAWGNSSVVALENSSVVAWENSSVVAWENSSVEAWGNSSVEALENSIDGLVEKSTSTSSKNSGSTSANVGNAYGAAGVVSASQSVAANAYVVSDTTVNFTLKHGQAYCFKMTVVNGNAMTPSFTVGNGDVLKTQFVAKIGNDYYYRVYATGTPGQSTGVYTALAGNAPVKHCAVTVA